MPPATPSQMVFRKPSMLKKRPRAPQHHPDLSPLPQDFTGVPLLPPNSSPLFDSWASEFQAIPDAPSPIGDFSLQSPVPGNLPHNGMHVLDTPLFDQHVLSSLQSPLALGALNFFPDLHSNPAGNPDSLLGRQQTHSHDIISFAANSPETHSTSVNSPGQQTQAIHVKSESNGMSNSPTSTTSSPTSSKRKDTVDTSGDEQKLDPMALKRKKNTDAARRSRLRKVQKMETLEKRVSDLEADNSKLQMKLAVLESEKTNSQSKEVEYSLRIKSLENQLAEAHRALTRR
ncbi:hypothetical protein K493DRAFT_321025 [Basidiobolus meristosporus CBS 931.73]|uniref:BZIP domain-containing protein n=1 Tax=Basidiobolus meristosporus CBS 931.73 TaxID=1314790 RepID=A0A1Y1X1X0_9FUNG|nr:hypothetical protein K493DRAFT_321025 [Basidiobolus meristosporus CBS 931.73]|eukprot:ORX79618.1 hypothetical protein K493DRAFT_321025 [Basidiobolus meristosporus CBS 931.73]